LVRVGHEGADREDRFVRGAHPLLILRQARGNKAELGSVARRDSIFELLGTKKFK
jgi:hypothetical protein